MYYGIEFIDDSNFEIWRNFAVDAQFNNVERGIERRLTDLLPVATKREQDALRAKLLVE